MPFARIVSSITQLLKHLWAILSSRCQDGMPPFRLLPSSQPHHFSFRPRTLHPAFLPVRSSLWRSALARQMDEIVPEKRRNLNSTERQDFFRWIIDFFIKKFEVNCLPQHFVLKAICHSSTERIFFLSLLWKYDSPGITLYFEEFYVNFSYSLIKLQ